MRWLNVAAALAPTSLGVHWQLNTTEIPYVNGLDANLHLPDQAFPLVEFFDELDRPNRRVDIRPVLLLVAKPGDAPQFDPANAVPWITC